MRPKINTFAMISHRVAMVIALAVFSAMPAWSLDLGYGGRLVDASGAAIAGPVDLSVRYYHSAEGGTAILSKSHPAVSLMYPRGHHHLDAASAA